MTTLQRHIKAKFNGQDIFCPHRDLNKLTDCLLKLICNDSMFERETGLKKERVGLAYLDTVEAITFNMDRYIQSKYLSIDIFDPTIAIIPLFQSKTPSQTDGTYVMIGTDHGQGTAQFLLRILLLGDSSDRRKYNQPDYNT